ncbi:MAG: hypothetical protein K8R53_07240 [Bacteroidales bacterium]|nr:hypothetical protein [Bacteroidales bacterium]
MTKLRVVHWFIYFILCLSQNLFSQELAGSGGSSGGLANSTVAVSNFWSITDNQAGLAILEKPEAGLYFENRFGIKELCTKTVAVGLPVSFGVIGADFIHYGYTGYNNKMAGITYARSFSKRFSAGLKLKYISTTIGEGYGTTSAVSFDAGAITTISEAITLGFHLSNPYIFQFSEIQQEISPAKIRLGMLYRISESLFCTLEAGKRIEYKPSFRAGIEYGPSEAFKVRIGYATIGSQVEDKPLWDQTLLTFGAGFTKNRFRADINAGFHQKLGWSPDISLNYQFK